MNGQKEKTDHDCFQHARLPPLQGALLPADARVRGPSGSLSLLLAQPRVRRGRKCDWDRNWAAHLDPIVALRRDRGRKRVIHLPNCRSAIHNLHICLHSFSVNSQQLLRMLSGIVVTIYRVDVTSLGSSPGRKQARTAARLVAASERSDKRVGCRRYVRVTQRRSDHR